MGPNFNSCFFLKEENWSVFKPNKKILRAKSI